MRIVLEPDRGEHPISGTLSRPGNQDTANFAGTVEPRALAQETGWLARPVTRIAGCVCAVLLTTTGCGQQETHRSSATAPSTSASSPLTAQEKTATSNLMRAFSRSGGFLIGKGACVATGLVRKVGLPELIAVGLLNKDLTVPKAVVNGDISLSGRDANMFADVTLTCVNWRLLAMGMVDTTPDLHDKYDRRCIAKVTRRDVRELLAAGYSGAEPKDGLPTMFKKLERAGCGFEGDD